MDVRDEIRARLPIEQLVGQYCQLQKRGRNFVSLCPFHNDTHPSFLVSPDKGIAYCFACQSGGDIFSVFQKLEGVDFPSAIRLLAEKAGVVIHEQPKYQKVEKDVGERIRACLEAAADFYSSQLASVEVAKAYAEKRGVPDSLTREFRLGYAPDSFFETYDHLLKRGFSRSEIVGAGLGVQKELRDERIYDRFRNRIMFPIADPLGRLVGFGGRTIGDADAKYVNSPEGPLYHKSSVLYGLAQAKEAIRTTRQVLLVEGYFDVVACHKAGVKNVVAVSGTALTEQHVRLLKRYADSVVLCLDQDHAGRQAADRAFLILCRERVPVYSVSLSAKDPDELVQREPAALRALVASASKPYLDATMEAVAGSALVREPVGKRRALDLLFPLLQALPSATELRAYLQKIAALLCSVESEIHADFTRFNSLAHVMPPKAVHAQVESLAFSRLELCLGIALLYCEQRALLAELIPPEEERWRTFCAFLKREEVRSLKPAEAIAHCSEDGQFREALAVLALYCEENFSHWSQSVASRELRKLINAANHDIMARKQSEIIGALKEARSTGHADDEAKLLIQYQQVLKLARMASLSATKNA